MGNRIFDALSLPLFLFQVADPVSFGGVGRSPPPFVSPLVIATDTIGVPQTRIRTLQADCTAIFLWLEPMQAMNFVVVRWLL